MAKTTRREAAEEALRLAQEARKVSKSKDEFCNRVFGTGGLFATLFPEQADRVVFVQSEEYKQIFRLYEEVESGNAGDAEAKGRMTLQVPLSLRNALNREAEAEGVSLNQLCLAKLSATLASLVS